MDEKTSEITLASGARIPVEAVAPHYSGLLYLHIAPGVSGADLMSAFDAPEGLGAITYGPQKFEGYVFDCIVKQGERYRVTLRKER